MCISLAISLSESEAVIVCFEFLLLLYRVVLIVPYFAFQFPISIIENRTHLLYLALLNVTTDTK